MSFRFKQFTINDEHTAMKVGTDGVLLGAWARVDAARRILDIGCGSGLITLMAAQRNPSADVTGVEIDEAAAGDARLNALASPFKERVKIICADILTFSAERSQYDCLLANPPYHEETLLPPSARRASARHTSGGGLTFASLLRAADTLLDKSAPNASFSLILPFAALKTFLPLAGVHGFCLSRQTDVITREGKQPKRALIELRPVCSDIEHAQLFLTTDGNQRTEQYSALCKDFYL